MSKLLYFGLCMLIGITITFPLIYILEPSYVQKCTNNQETTDNFLVVIYSLLFPLIFTIVSLAILVGIQQKCIF